ncbi:cytochrome p450 [Trichoderma arundinaceum]|uniref:Cytochrome p450 n=1 Tax=Trichoderma arundinaceum TaxID=490622 RepID=A0A395NG28_TRIAR|nr:cytochrome p450 [Trichoderma arundinaceum]
MDLRTSTSSPSIENLSEVPPGHTSVYLGLGFCLFLVIWHYSDVSGHDPREPPIVKPSIPLIGHFVGFYRYGVNYLDHMRRHTSWPAYTLKVLGHKTYVVTTPGLSHAALKSKAMSMDPLTANVAPKMLGLSKESDRHFGIDHTGFYNGSSALRERREEFSHALAPGPGVNHPSQVCSNVVAEAVNAFGADWTTKDLFLWLRDVITLGTANGLYGPNSPVALDQSLIEDIWTFDENQLRLSWGILPNLVAPSGVRTLVKISQAFQEFVRKGNDEFASDAVKSSIATARKMDVSADDYSRIEVFNVSVATVNTVPTAVAMIQNILANTDLLKALRKELEAILTTKETFQGLQAELDIGRAEIDCPLLHACYQEALRIGSTPTCNRAVLEDVVLTDPDTGREILFKKGWRVSIPTFLLHNRDTFWGGDAESFRPEKFLPGGFATDGKGKVRTQGFVPYGGGAHLCPGRHLAKMEILASSALVIMALDMKAENGFVAQNYTLTSGARKPAGMENIKIKRREGWENAEWTVKI